jgi:pimeloyl-ACP methyl ester carboxylesterase
MDLLTLPSGTLAHRADGAGPPLLLLSANPGEHRDFDAIHPVLARRFRVHAFDWPGYGASPAPPDPAASSAMGFARLLREAIDHLGLGPAVALGNSVGGYAAVRLALDAPGAVRALILVSPGGFTAHNAFTRAFCRLKGTEGFTRFSNPWFAAWYLKRRTPLTREILARATGEQATPSAVAVNAAVWRSFVDPAHDLRARAANVQAPVWLAFGRHDPVIPAKADGRVAHASLPGAEFHVFDTGHMPFAEDPDAFLAALTPFLDRVLDQRAAA